MEKYLFLDMDGVINSVEYSVSRRPHKSEFRWMDADPVKLGLIRFICNQTDAKIVISSTWRHGRTIDWFLGYLEYAGWPIAPVVGLTPSISKICSISPTKTGRGDEVFAWLDQHDIDSTIFGSHVILDDDSDFYDWQPLVHCNGVYGITLKETLEAINILGLGKEGDAQLIADLQLHVDFICEM